MRHPHTYLLTLLGGNGWFAADYDALESELFDAIDAGVLTVADEDVRISADVLGGYRPLNRAERDAIRGGRLYVGNGNHEVVTYYPEPKAFREWLQRTRWWPLPDGCELAEWCGSEAQAEPEAQPGNRGPRPDTIERRDRLEAILNEIERRAKDAGVPYSRESHPGNSKQFAEFILKWDSKLLYELPDWNGERFKDELHALGVRFKGGNQKAKGDRFYRALFPEIE